MINIAFVVVHEQLAALARMSTDSVPLSISTCSTRSIGNGPSIDSAAAVFANCCAQADEGNIRFPTMADARMAYKAPIEPKDVDAIVDDLISIRGAN